MKYPWRVHFDDFLIQNPFELNNWHFIVADSLFSTNFDVKWSKFINIAVLTVFNIGLLLNYSYDFDRSLFFVFTVFGLIVIVVLSNITLSSFLIHSDLWSFWRFSEGHFIKSYLYARVHSSMTLSRNRIQFIWYAWWDRTVLVLLYNEHTVIIWIHICITLRPVWPGSGQ